MYLQNLIFIAITKDILNTNKFDEELFLYIENKNLQGHKF